MGPVFLRIEPTFESSFFGSVFVSETGVVFTGCFLPGLVSGDMAGAGFDSDQRTLIQSHRLKKGPGDVHQHVSRLLFWNDPLAQQVEFLAHALRFELQRNFGHLGLAHGAEQNVTLHFERYGDAAVAGESFLNLGSSHADFDFGLDFPGLLG